MESCTLIEFYQSVNQHYTNNFTKGTNKVSIIAIFNTITKLCYLQNVLEPSALLF